MIERLLGFRTIQRKIESKIIQLAYIPSKFLEALYIECGTQIPCHTLDICVVEEKQIRGELLKLMKEGEVDTKIELEKFQLFERINYVSIKARDVRLHMNEFYDKLSKDDYNHLVIILKDVSQASKLMYQSIKNLYENYDEALESVDLLAKKCNSIIDGLFKFKYCDDDDCEYSFDKGEVIIGNALRSVLQEIIGVGEKVATIVKIFSHHHKEIKEKERISLMDRIRQNNRNLKMKRQIRREKGKIVKKQRREKRKNN